MSTVIILEGFSSGENIIIVILVCILCATIIGYTLKMAEMAYVIRRKKPYYIFIPFFLKKLDSKQKQILLKEFTFYKNLKPKHRVYFEHRVVSFIKDKKFVGRDGLLVTEEMRILISATAVMLTFGFRDYYIGLIDNIFIYPNEFYSTFNQNYHKGEFNPKLQTLVLSWSDFEKGFDSSNDNINLGIHEFAHAIHLNSFKERDVSSTLFVDSFKELMALLAANEPLRNSLIESRYFREYAYTNQYEFVAVIIETFMESPSEFRSQFPEVYNKTKQMLNFNFAGY